MAETPKKPGIFNTAMKAIRDAVEPAGDKAEKTTATTTPRSSSRPAAFRMPFGSTPKLPGVDSLNENPRSSPSLPAATGSSSRNSSGLDVEDPGLHPRNPRSRKTSRVDLSSETSSPLIPEPPFPQETKKKKSLIPSLSFLKSPKKRQEESKTEETMSKEPNAQRSARRMSHEQYSRDPDASARLGQVRNHSEMNLASLRSQQTEIGNCRRNKDGQADLQGHPSSSSSPAVQKNNKDAKSPRPRRQSQEFKLSDKISASDPYAGLYIQTSDAVMRELNEKIDKEREAKWVQYEMKYLAAMSKTKQIRRPAIAISDQRAGSEPTNTVAEPSTLVDGDWREVVDLYHSEELGIADDDGSAPTTSAVEASGSQGTPISNPAPMEPHAEEGMSKAGVFEGQEVESSGSLAAKAENNLPKERHGNTMIPFSKRDLTVPAMVGTQKPEVSQSFASEPQQHLETDPVVVNTDTESISIVPTRAIREQSQPIQRRDTTHRSLRPARGSVLLLAPPSPENTQYSRTSAPDNAQHTVGEEQVEALDSTEVETPILTSTQYRRLLLPTPKGPRPMTPGHLRAGTPLRVVTGPPSMGTGGGSRVMEADEDGSDQARTLDESKGVPMSDSDLAKATALDSQEGDEMKSKFYSSPPNPSPEEIREAEAEINNIEEQLLAAEMHLANLRLELNAEFEKIDCRAVLNLAASNGNTYEEDVVELQERCKKLKEDEKAVEETKREVVEARGRLHIYKEKNV